jgi:GT2 family glycosyltransferase/glycosyltransferase involved in cell wall biosynthesis
MRPCTVIVPVYNSFPEALACIRSVLAQTAGEYRLLVFDDASPEGRLAQFLPDEVRRDPHLTLVRNDRNLGFVKTCNEAMRQAGQDDVVLLNSDTEVTAGWLERLRAAAYSDPQIGTVTPFTNNGEVCSLPNPFADNALPPGYGLDEFAALIESCSQRAYPELPTCIGFCVYIKREVLDRVGLFDEDSFGRGYGEENDLSCRAQAAGYRDVLDDATFVYHKGRMSFRDETAQLSLKNLAILEKKHPGYQRRIQDFVMANSLHAVHTRVYDAMLRRWLESNEYSVLHLLHKEPSTGESALPGGVEYHVGDLVRSSAGAHWSFYANEQGGYSLKAHIPGRERVFHFNATDFDFYRLLDPALFNVVHLHHASRFPYSAVAAALRRHGRYFVSLHDFALCCPRLHLVDREGHYCGPNGCPDRCDDRRAEVRQLQTTTASVLRGARAVFHFSHSTREHYAQRVGNDYPWRLLEHGIRMAEGRNGRPAAETRVPKPEGGEPLRVAFLGGISTIKGSQLVRQLAAHRTLPSGAPVEWHLIGLFEGPVPENVVNHGRYVRDELPAVMRRVRPHLVAIASICPETYCYTLEESLVCGIPVLVTPLGAPAERVTEYGCGWVLPALEVDAFLGRLDGILARWNEYQAVRGRIAVLPLRTTSEVGARYTECYRSVCGLKKARSASRVLETIEELHRVKGHRVAPARLWAGRALNRSLRLLEAAGVRRFTAHVAARMLPGRWHRAIHELRMSATRSAQL